MSSKGTFTTKRERENKTESIRPLLDSFLCAFVPQGSLSAAKRHSPLSWWLNKFGSSYA